MQTAPRPATSGGPKKVRATSAPPRRARRGPRPITIGIIAVLALLSLGTMGIVLAGLWPGERGHGASPTATPEPRLAGMKVEPAGERRRDGEQWIIPVKVTNNVQQSAAIEGTPTPGVATPTPGPANVHNAVVRVYFYDGEGHIIGNAVGNATNIPYGQSKIVDVVATGVGDFERYELLVDDIWTDKDPVPPTATPSP